MDPSIVKIRCRLQNNPITHRRYCNPVLPEFGAASPRENAPGERAKKSAGSRGSTSGNGSGGDRWWSNGVLTASSAVDNMIQLLDAWRRSMPRESFTTTSGRATPSSTATLHPRDRLRHRLQAGRGPAEDEARDTARQQGLHGPRAPRRRTTERCKRPVLCGGRDVADVERTASVLPRGRQGREGDSLPLSRVPGPVSRQGSLSQVLRGP